MTDSDPEVSWRKIPWLEIILVFGLVVMILTSINALLGQKIQEGLSSVCAELDLWCAPTATPSPTPTPTITPTPLLTTTPLLTATVTP